MRALKHDDLIEAEISVAPLVDVFLVLMIILLVVVPMVRVSTAEAVPDAADTAKAGRPASVQRPRSPGPDVLALEQPHLAVAILADGSLVVDGRIVEPVQLQKTLGEIRALTPDRPVVIKGDRRLRYEQVRWVLQSVNAAGFRRAGLMADRAEQ